MDVPLQTVAPFQHYLEKLPDRYHGVVEGTVADYIPELSRARPEWFGIALATADGHVYQVGDAHQPFTIQSISKVIAYGLALEDNGIDAVTARVGVEPSGDVFNAIDLDPDTGQPCNPMINAGAIATAGMIRDADGVHRVQRVLDTMQRYVGHPVSIDEKVYRSESETGHRNRAIAHLLRNFAILEEHPDETLALYFKQYSINVTCRDLAVMAACLANNGVNPITGVVALDNRYVVKVLSVMGSCGMYDYSGNWLYRVGMPAKSGVGGGIIAVLPGQFGLAVFSPPLDAQGNSVLGIRVCEDISAHFELHLYHAVRATSASVLRVKYDGSRVNSRKVRRETDVQALAAKGHVIRVYELQGNLLFGSSDSVIREIINETDTCRYIIVDLKRVVEMDAASRRLFLETAQMFRAAGKEMFFTGTHAQYPFVRYFRKHAEDGLREEAHRLRDTDHAMEWCEDQLLGAGPASPAAGCRCRSSRSAPVSRAFR